MRFRSSIGSPVPGPSARAMAYGPSAAGAIVLLTALLGCSAEARVTGMEIRDPLGLIDDVYMSGNSLRLVVLPAEAYPCEPTTGIVRGWSDASDAVAVGMAADAIVDISLERAETADHSVSVPSGSWTVLVRGRGDDTATGRMDVIIATGCSPASVEAGGTVEVSVLLAPVTVAGVCGDGILSRDEQCEGGPACTACRTQPEPLNTTTGITHARVRLGTRTGQRSAVVFEETRSGGFPGIGLRLLDPDGRPLTIPTLASDVPLDMSGETLMGQQGAPAIAIAGDGRIAIALRDDPPMMGDVRIGFWNPSNRMIAAASANVRTEAGGMQGNPAVAIAGSGATMVVFEDSRSSTGLSGRIVPMGSTMPAGPEAFEVGTGRSGASSPAIAGTASGFIVAFAAGGDVFYQRFSDAGAATDASALPVADPGGGRDGPAIGAANDGSFLVAWAEANGDGAGRAVRARVFAASGIAVGPAFTVNTTTAGDQTRPAVGASDAAFVVAFESGGTVRARAFATNGDPQLNREQPPSFADFEVAASGTAPDATRVGNGAMQAWWIGYQAGTDLFARRLPL